jgi:parvulin-like peptidyl-prolyl isomerase
MTIDPSTREPLSDDAVQAKHKQAEDVLTRARAGEDFAKLAEQYSEDPTSKNNGGELPPIQHGEMAAEFDEAAFSLATNQVSDLVKTIYGYDIIKLVSKTPAKKFALTDAIPDSDQTFSDWIKSILVQKNFAPAYLEKLKNEDGVKILDPDLNAAVQALLAASKTNTPAEK